MLTAPHPAAATVSPYTTLFRSPTGTGSDGKCTVTFTSNSAGIVVGHASLARTSTTVSLKRQTDSIHGLTRDATKRFVDANISITPDGVNKVGDPHTFTVLVQQDDVLVEA